MLALHKVAHVLDGVVEAGEYIYDPLADGALELVIPPGTAANDPFYGLLGPSSPTTASGIFEYEEFHPFGSTSYAANDAAVEVSPKRYRYIGKERDEETGLYHLGARYYAAWLGRWTAADPTGLGDGVNRYAYCRGNPVALRDTEGAAAVAATDPGVLTAMLQAEATRQAGLALRDRSRVRAATSARVQALSADGAPQYAKSFDTLAAIGPITEAQALRDENRQQHLPLCCVTTRG